MYERAGERARRLIMRDSSWIYIYPGQIRLKKERKKERERERERENAYDKAGGKICAGDRSCMNR